MDRACPVLTPEQRRISEIVQSVGHAMLDKVHAAVAEAAERAGESIRAAGLDQPPPAEGYFQSLVHQEMFVALCGATRGTFEGGNAGRAVAIIRNEQLIAKTHWGAEIEVLPKPGAGPA